MDKRHLHKFKLECVNHGRYVDFIEHAIDPIEAIHQLWIRKPSVHIYVVTDLDVEEFILNKSFWNLTYLLEHKEEIKIKYDLIYC